MNRQEAVKRLDAIEKEQAELRRIIEQPEVVYDNSKMYVGVSGDGEPSILHGREGRGFWFFVLIYFPTEAEINIKADTAQDCIDSFLSDSGSVYEFSDPLEGLEFFMRKYRDYYYTGLNYEE